MADQVLEHCDAGDEITKINVKIDEENLDCMQCMEECLEVGCGDQLQSKNVRLLNSHSVNDMSKCEDHSTSSNNEKVNSQYSLTDVDLNSDQLVINPSFVTLFDGSVVDFITATDDKSNIAKINEIVLWLCKTFKITVPSNTVDEIVCKEDYEDKISNLLQTNKSLEKLKMQLEHDLKLRDEKLIAHDASAKRAIANLQQDYENKIQDLNKRLSTAASDRQTSVMNYARKEKEILDLQKKNVTVEESAKAAIKEKDKLGSQLKTIRSDFTKMKNVLEKKENECLTTHQDLQKLKDEINSQAIKVRWAQNKLKTEVDNHRETKERCEKMQLEIQQAKEETEQIRRNCQEMVKTYQESEEMKSNSLDVELKEKLQIISDKENALEEMRDHYMRKNNELNVLNVRHKELMDDNATLLSKLSLLNEDREKNDQVMRTYEEVMNKQKQNAVELSQKLSLIAALEAQVEESGNEMKKLKVQLADEQTNHQSIMEDLNRKTAKEQQLLIFTEKVSSKNSHLTVSNEELSNKVKAQSTELDSCKQKTIELVQQVEDLKTEMGKAQKQHDLRTRETDQRIDSKEKTICQLMLQLEELKDEMRTLKRKNAAMVKDLTRQLNQAKKKMDNDEGSASSCQNNYHDITSLGSRTSSTASLDKINVDINNTSTYYGEHDMIPNTTVASPETFDRQMMIERIVRLQQIHAKKNEKIDFLTGHIESLIDEIRKKQKLIEHYILREEAGVLAPPKFNRPRPALTLDLSMEINRKMQSVLEDTILKNIALKESLELMGKEVQRLQKAT